MNSTFVLIFVRDLEDLRAFICICLCVCVCEDMCFWSIMAVLLFLVFRSVGVLFLFFFLSVCVCVCVSFCGLCVCVPLCVVTLML